MARAQPTRSCVEWWSRRASSCRVRRWAPSSRAPRRSASRATSRRPSGLARVVVRRRRHHGEGIDRALDEDAQDHHEVEPRGRDQLDVMTEVTDVARETGISLDAQWMPFTANRAFKRAPRLLASAKGMY